MGYLKVDRKLFKHWIWQSNEEYSKRDAWIDLLQTAHYADDPRKEHISGKLIELHRGQLIGAIRYLKTRWNWKSNDKVARYLKLLVDEKMISIETGQGVSVISISKYGDYNPINSYDQDSNGTETGQKSDTDGTQTGQKSDEIKESKEYKEIKKEKDTPSGVNPPLNEDLQNEFLKVIALIAAGTRVKKIDNQLTPGQFKSIREKYEYDQIITALEIMENTKSITNRTSVNLTLQNLIRKEGGSPEVKKWVPKFKEVYRDNIAIISGGTVTEPKISGREETALYSLIEFLKANCNAKTYEGSLLSFKYIFDNWHTLEVFYQNRVRISEINKDITKIMIQIKNHGSKKTIGANNNSKSKGDKKNY